MKKAILLFLCVLSAAAHAGGDPRVFTTDPAALMRARETAQRDPNLPALAQLRADADRALKLAPLSVTDKSVVPPSGDKHDYITLAPYWWPNPNTPNGLPYVRRDGERNPDISKLADHRHFDQVMSASYTLALAHYLLGDERYAAHAAELLRAWFLDPATRMNPNLQYAQGVRGINDGRGIGLIETRGIGKVVDAVGLLAGSKSWSAIDDAGMRKWFSDYLSWVRNSKNGRDEAAAKNNHGTYYDVQIAVLALGTGKPEIAREVIENAKRRRIDFQIEPDGREPLELARTKSWGYSVMNLSGLFLLARLGDRAGVDLWNYRGPEGRSIRAALDYLLPVALGERKWTTKQIEPLDPRTIVPLLLDASAHYREPRYREAAFKLDANVARSLPALLTNESTRGTPAAQPQRGR